MGYYKDKVIDFINEVKQKDPREKTKKDLSKDDSN